MSERERPTPGCDRRRSLAAGPALFLVSLMFSMLVMLLMLVMATTPSRAAERVAGAAPASPPKSPPAVSAFLQAHCADCHTGADAQGGLELATLQFDPAAPDGDARWARVIERVESREMPPPDATGLDDDLRRSFVREASIWLSSAVRRRDAALGRVRGRRLTRREVERSLHALTGIDIPLTHLLPAEGRPGGYTTTASRQTMSHHHLEAHLSAVDAALDEALRRALGPTRSLTRSFDARGLSRNDPKRRCREPELREGRAVVWSGGPEYYGRLPVTAAPEDGWYRFTVVASGLKLPDSGGVWCSVRSGLCVSSAPLLEFVTAFEAQAEPREIRFECWLPRGHMIEIRPADVTLKRGRFAGGQVGVGEGDPQEVPGLALERLTMERFHRGPDDAGVRRLLFGDVPLEPDAKAKGFRVASSTPREDAGRLVTAFARRAFRRPVADEEVAGMIALAHGVLDDGGSLGDAIRAGYRAVLCSPRFLYFSEGSGLLDDHAVATRLSFFLTGGPPDAELGALADAGDLAGRPTVLRAQADRLLADEGGRRFLEDFAAEWLDLDQIDFTEPDRKLFPRFDPIVQAGMLAETHAFLEAMLRDNLPVRRLVDADFTHLHSRLARFYGIPGVTGDALERVALPTTSHRGGLLAQGAILKVTANGSTTSPVVRGVWVCERLLGIEIPPPPANVPAIEPDIRGATTIREQLARHRADPACASCHRHIDPIGFALENFDPAGQWRERYPVVGKRERPKIDASDVLVTGRRFDGIDEFKEIAAAAEPRLARNLAAHLVAYGTGAPVSFADRRAVAEIATVAGDDGHGFRSVIHAVITHPIFLSK
jgi:mono/diheme cytochrome c family protein